MGLFSKTKRGRPRKRPKTLKEILSDALTKEVNRDPELKRELALREGGYTDILGRDKETEKNKREIKSFIIGEALKKIKEDPELAEQFVESQVDDILSGGKPSSRRRKGEPEYYGNEGISSISQALEEVESLSMLREKLQDLGMVDGGGKGFLKGMTMKDVLDVLPFIAAIMGKNAPETQPTRTYIVRINGSDQAISEAEYARLLQEGRLQPIAALEAPKTKKQPPEVTSKIPELPEYIRGTDFTIVEGWMEQEPEEFVTNLKLEVDAEIQESRFIWGFLTTATYDGITEKIIPYREHPEVKHLVERVLSEEGKAWIEQVLTLVQTEAVNG